jgi:hypothetical protein
MVVCTCHPKVCGKLRSKGWRFQASPGKKFKRPPSLGQKLCVVVYAVIPATVKSINRRIVIQAYQGKK